MPCPCQRRALFQLLLRVAVTVALEAQEAVHSGVRTGLLCPPSHPVRRLPTLQRAMGLWVSHHLLRPHHQSRPHRFQLNLFSLLVRAPLRISAHHPRALWLHPPLHPRLDLCRCEFVRTPCAPVIRNAVPREEAVECGRPVIASH